MGIHKIAAGAFLVAGLFLSPFAQAQESQAKSWNLAGEEKAVFSGKVVDILCELTGDCPAGCAGGARQLGILRDDGRLILPAKNAQANFAGAVADLLPYCGKLVDVDGLMLGDSVKLFQVQFIREQGKAEWQKANGFSNAWAARFPDDAKKKGPWFRKDSRVMALIERDGWLGLGHPADREFLEWYE